MLNFKTFAALVVSTFISCSAFAEGKVVVFNFEKAILSTEAAKKASASLSADPEFAALQAKYEGLIAELQALREEQQTKGITWDANQQAEHRKNVEYKRADLELAQKKLQAEQNAAVRGLLQEFETKTKTALEEVIKAQGISVVLNSSQVYFVDPAADITALVTEKLNKQ